MLGLNGDWRNMPFTSHSLLFPRRARADTPVTSVVADTVHGGSVDHGRVVNVVDNGDVHVVHGAVVEKVAVVPTSAFVAISKVAVSVVDTAVEADLRTPIAFVESKSAFVPRPISWSP